MQVALTCRHGSIPEHVHEYITQKAEKLITYFERVTAIQVTVDFEKNHNRVKVEIVVDAERTSNFVSHAEGEGVPAMFDQALHKMEQQLRKYKEKIHDHRRERSLKEIVQSESPESEVE